MTDYYKKELSTITKAMIDTGLVSKIILFGSLARGEEHEDSDIDLCALTPVLDRRAIDVGLDLRLSFSRFMTIPVDLLTYNQAKFAEFASDKFSLAHKIQTEGIVIYES